MEKLTTALQAASLSEYLIAGGVALTFVGLAALGIVNGRKEHARLIERQRDLEARELAVMTEEIRFTGGGGFCVAMIVLTLLWCVASLSLATTVFQQIQYGIMLIANLILFGLGAALGRRRTYKIRRSQHRVEHERTPPKFN